MKKLEQIIANNARASNSGRRVGLRGGRARIMLLTLTTLLVLFVFYTQPPVQAAIGALLDKLPRP